MVVTWPLCFSSVVLVVVWLGSLVQSFQFAFELSEGLRRRPDQRARTNSLHHLLLHNLNVATAVATYFDFCLPKVRVTPTTLLEARFQLNELCFNQLDCK